MNHGIGDRARRMPRPLAAFLVLLVLAAPLLRSAPPAAARSVEDAPLDLAALALTPAALEAEGLEGYGVADGDTRSPEAVAAGFAFQRGLPDDEARTMFAESGLIQAYELRLDLPAGSGSGVTASVSSTIHEYADEDGAAAGFAILTDWGDSETVEEVETDAAIGDESFLVRHRGTTPDPFHALDLVFQSGHVTAVVRLVDFTGDEPASSVVERLGARLLARIDAEHTERATGLGELAIRVTGEGAFPGGDVYVVHDGEARQEFGQSVEDFAADAEEIADAGLIDEFTVWQRINTSSLTDDIYFYSIVQRFSDEEAASAHLRGTPDRWADDEGFDGFEEIEGLAVFGEEALAFAQTFHWASRDTDLTYQTYYLRVGDYLGLVEVIAAEALPPAMLEELAAAQAACLEAEGCAEPVPLPDDLQALAVDPVYGNPDAEGRMADASLPDRRTWTGPSGDIELTYDPAAWEAAPEELLTGDDLLMLIEDGGQSVVTLSVSTNSDGADACVDDLIAPIAAAEARSVVRPVSDETGQPLAGGDGDRAYAAYAVAADGGNHTFMYFECRTFADGDSVLVVTHGGPLDRYDTLSATREDLLDGLVLPDD